ncbi:MAG: hypothetical protein OXH73_10185 [Caldilineaceae bacterium]|nr:hypothetical protein [Caldilineaceae bacterium]
MPAKDCTRSRNMPQSGNGRRPRGSLFIWMAALFAAAVLSACIIVNPPPAPTPTPIPTATPTRQTVIDAVRVTEGGDPPVIGQTVRVALTLDEDSYSDRSRWQWERSDDGLTNWRNVPGARLTDSSLYAPVAADDGKYLRASVSFVDSDGAGKTALSPTAGPVVGAEIETDAVEFAFGNDPAVVSRGVRARISLPNSDYSDPGRWRWDRSDNALRGWTDVTDYDAEDSSVFIPSSLENGKYLRASVVYLDSSGEYKRGLSQTIGPVITVETVADVVTFSAGADPPTVDTEITVEITLSGGDYSDLGSWKWERSNDGLGKWEDITDYDAANSSRYTPTAADEGKYLRTSALYIDSDGERKRALSQTIGPVAD